ncbi:MAG: nucleotidyltransferase family protein [Ghiorsea sp.]|nr:nucleotidyltransferase family protein [Ghiorsea sp.]
MKQYNFWSYRESACKLLQGNIPEHVLSNTDFWTLAQADAMFPLLWTSLTETQKDTARPWLLNPMNERVFVADALRLKHATSRVLRAYHDANIPIICMRGLAVSEQLYPKSYLRPHTDIDILFDKKHLLMAKQVAGSVLHYRPINAYPMLFKLGDIPLDLHIEPIGSERIQAWKHITPLHADDFFKFSQDGKIAGEDAKIVDPRVMLPYLCFHALKHSFERLIWLYDIALLAKKIEEQSQWDEVLEGIVEYRLERPCFYALSYVEAHMNTPIPAFILEQTQPKMGFIEKRLFKRFMNHEIIPYMAERLFARMLPSVRLRISFWRETIYPREEIRAQVAGGGCVKCNFIRTRLKQITRALWAMSREIIQIIRA